MIISQEVSWRIECDNIGICVIRWVVGAYQVDVGREAQRETCTIWFVRRTDRSLDNASNPTRRIDRVARERVNTIEKDWHNHVCVDCKSACAMWSSGVRKPTVRKYYLRMICFSATSFGETTKFALIFHVINDCLVCRDARKLFFSNCMFGFTLSR